MCSYKVMFSVPTRFIAAAGMGVGAVAISAASIAPGVRTNIADPCATNDVTQVYFDGCLPSIDAPQAQVNQRGPNQVPEIRGIPCNGSNTGTCIGLSRLPGGPNAQPDATAPQPDTQVRSSP